MEPKQLKGLVWLAPIAVILLLAVLAVIVAVSPFVTLVLLVNMAFNKGSIDFSVKKSSTKPERKIIRSFKKMSLN